MANSSTWTNRRSAATRSISATACSGLCTGTRIEARSRGSRSSSSFATQSLTAEHSAIAMSSLNSATAPCSTLQMAKRAAERIERLAADHVEVPPGAPDLLPPVRPRAERRIRRIAGQVERVSGDVAIDELIAPVFIEIGQQRPTRSGGAGCRSQSIAPLIGTFMDGLLRVSCGLRAVTELWRATIIGEDRMFKHGHRAVATAAIGIAVGLFPTAGHAQDIDILMALPAPTLTFSSAVHRRGCRISTRRKASRSRHRTLVGVGSPNAVIAGSADFTIGTGPVFLRAPRRGSGCSPSPI